MTKTRVETIDLAFRHLRINATGETAATEENTYASDVLDGVLAELTSTQGITLAFDVDDDVYLPLSYLLAYEIAPHYNESPPIARADAIARIRAVEIVNDAEDRRDTNNDTVISTAEAEAGDRATFY